MIHIFILRSIFTVCLQSFKFFILTIFLKGFKQIMSVFCLVNSFFCTHFYYFFGFLFKLEQNFNIFDSLQLVAVVLISLVSILLSPGELEDVLQQKNYYKELYIPSLACALYVLHKLPDFSPNFLQFL